jgi:hypothetical protein
MLNVMQQLFSVFLGMKKPGYQEQGYQVTATREV